MHNALVAAGQHRDAIGRRLSDGSSGRPTVLTERPRHRMQMRRHPDELHILCADELEACVTSGYFNFRSARRSSTAACRRSVESAPQLRPTDSMSALDHAPMCTEECANEFKYCTNGFEYRTCLDDLRHSRAALDGLRAPELHTHL